MLEFNIDRIREIIGEINFAHSKLETIGKLDEEDFLKSQEKIDSAKYNMSLLNDPYRSEGTNSHPIFTLTKYETKQTKETREILLRNGI